MPITKINNASLNNNNFVVPQHGSQLSISGTTPINLRANAEDTIIQTDNNTIVLYLPLIRDEIPGATLKFYLTAGGTIILTARGSDTIEGNPTLTLSPANGKFSTIAAAKNIGWYSFADVKGVSNISGVPSIGQIPISTGTGAASWQTPQLTYMLNIAALRANTQTDIAHVMLSGYYTVTDNGGGKFEKVAGDTTSADNNGTIIVDAIGTRWYRSVTGPTSPLWFGAKGDGVTDDGIALNQCLAWMWSYYKVGGNSVMTLCDGAYGTTIPIMNPLVSGSNIVIRDGRVVALAGFPSNYSSLDTSVPGPGLFTLVGNANVSPWSSSGVYTAPPVIGGIGVGGVKLQNVVIDANKNADVAFLAYCSSFTLDSCFVSEFRRWGVYQTSGPQTNVGNCGVINCTIRQFINGTSYNYGGNAIAYRGGFFIGPGCGFYSDCNDSVFSNNTVSKTDIGFYLNVGSAWQVKDNHFYNCTTAGINLLSSGANITGNYMDAACINLISPDTSIISNNYWVVGTACASILFNRKAGAGTGLPQCPIIGNNIKPKAGPGGGVMTLSATGPVGTVVNVSWDTNTTGFTANMTTGLSVYEGTASGGIGYLTSLNMINTPFTATMMVQQVFSATTFASNQWKANGGEILFDPSVDSASVSKINIPSYGNLLTTASGFPIQKDFSQHGRDYSNNLTFMRASDGGASQIQIGGNVLTNKADDGNANLIINGTTNSVTAGKLNTITTGPSFIVGYSNLAKGPNSGSFGSSNSVNSIGSYAMGNTNSVTGDGSTAIGNGITLTLANTIQIGAPTQNVLLASINSIGSLPGIASGTAIGTGGSPSVVLGANANDLVGSVQINTGTSVTSSGNIFTITFAVAKTHAPRIILITANTPTGTAAMVTYGIYPDSTNWATTGWTLNCTSNLPVSTSYTIRYLVIT